MKIKFIIIIGIFLSTIEIYSQENFSMDSLHAQLLQNNEYKLLTIETRSVSYVFFLDEKNWNLYLFDSQKLLKRYQDLKSPIKEEISSIVNDIKNDTFLKNQQVHIELDHLKANFILKVRYKRSPWLSYELESNEESKMIFNKSYWYFSFGILRIKKEKKYAKMLLSLVNKIEN